MNDLKKIEYNKKLLIALIIVLILYIVLLIVKNNNDQAYSNYKDDESKEYVYTKYESTKNNAKVPYINLVTEDAKKVNQEILTLATEYLKATNKNKTVTYRYNQNKNILSVVLTFRDINQYDQLKYRYKTYVFDLKNSAKLLTNNQIIDKFNITYDEINEIMAKAMKEKYVDEVRKGFIEKNECNYSCFLENRNINNYIDQANYYIENSHLMVYRAFEVYSIYGEEEYFTRNDFKFLIK